MKRLLFALLFCPALALSQGTLQNFEKIVLTGSKDLRIRFDANQTPQINAPSGSGWISQNGEVVTISRNEDLPAEKELEVTTSTLKKVAVMGSGTITVEGFKGEALEVQIVGSGDVVLQGECGDLDISVAGSGDVKAKDLVVKTAKVSVMGSGDAYVAASDSLKISIMGSGDVHYYGKPQNLKKSVLGTGDVISEE